MHRFIRASIWSLLGIGLVAFLVWLLQPAPIGVEWGEVQLGPMSVRLRDEGQTRVRERYRVSAPVAGQLERITLRPGDFLYSGRTLLAGIHPSPPGMLDARQLPTAEAQLAAAQSLVERATARLEQALLTLEHAEQQHRRAEALLSDSAIAKEAFEDAENRLRLASKAQRIASFDLEIAKFEQRQAEAALLIAQPNPDEPPQFHRIQSPIDGVVLRLFEESATIVQPGNPLMEIGDLSDLEINIELLSSDAVRVAPGQPIVINHWGGPEPLKGRVRRIEPAAFTKTSALGIDEQRVNVLGDFDEPLESLGRLGDGFRVEAEIVIWQSDSVLLVPSAALFRLPSGWGVFVIERGVIRERRVELGQRNPNVAQVLSGLEPGEQVVVYPSDRVRDGAAARLESRWSPPADSSDMPVSTSL